MAEAIPFTNLLYLLLPLVASGYLYYRWCGHKFEVATATLRMTLQLILVGYILVFLFQNTNYWLGCIILGVMIMASSIIAIRPFPNKGWTELKLSLLSIGLSGTITLALVLGAVMDLSPLYQPRLVIPIAGMIYSNAMNTISLAGERYYKELSNGSSLQDARSNAYQAALIPQVNSFLAVGLVSLPGMMTGQILSGVSPLIAVRYQIMVMAMVFGSAGIAAGIFLYLANRQKEKVA